LKNLQQILRNYQKYLN